MGAAMFYPRTSVLPTIKTSLPSSINCLTNHRVDGAHQSRFHEHNHCWLQSTAVQKEGKFIYLTKSRQSCSGAAVLVWEQNVDAAAPFSFFNERKTAFSAAAATWQLRKLLKSFALFEMSEPLGKARGPMPVRRGGTPPYYYYHVPHILRLANKCPAINTRTNCREKRRSAARSA